MELLNFLEDLFQRKKGIFAAIFLFSAFAFAGAFYDKLNVDNIQIDSNTISTTNSNGDLTLTPNGAGNVILSHLSTGSRFLESGGSGEVLESGLTTTEGDQLENIDSVTISNTQWGYLGALDQGLTTGSATTFTGITLSGLTASTVPVLDGAKALSDSNISATEFDFLDGQDQAIGTDDTPSFNGLTLTGNLDTNLTTTGVVISDSMGLISAETQLAVSRGGTGSATASSAFDALSPMTAEGDVIYGGASGTGTRLAKGTDGEVLKLSGGVPTWAADNTGSSLTMTAIDNTDSPYTLTSSTDILLVDASSAAVSITFPDASTVGAGWNVVIKVTDDSIYDVTLNRATTDLIESETSQVLSTPGIAFNFFSDGTSDFHAY